MMALRGALKRLGVRVVNNSFSGGVDVHICNSAWFDRDLFEKKAAAALVRMIHRIDGPTTLYRGEGSVEDDRIFELNRQFASATVFQSAYCFKKSYELGYRAVAPVVIHNSVDPGVFHDRGRVGFDPGRKVRLISSAWSDNPRKGGPLFKWLDEHLDWDRFEYTFVGRVKERFDRINHIPPQNSQALAGLLREHHIFVSASRHEPCSNALLEAMGCGLPVLYRDDGGNGELVSFAGRPFTGKEDILDQLDRLVDAYTAYRRLIDLRTIDEIARRYLSLARKLVDVHPDRSVP
jgi:glycosyltransferase involved in cell wall biosynthesis